MLPVKPNLMTDFFASRHQPHRIRCEDYTPARAPQVRPSTGCASTVQNF